MPTIKSFHLYTPRKGNPFKATWESFNSMEKFTRLMVIFFFLFILSTPFIVNNPQIFKSRAQTDIPEAITQESNIQNNAYELCTEFQGVKADLECENAINRALAIAQGQIINLSVGSKRIADPASSPPKRTSKDFWFVDIELSKPYFDEYIKKEIHKLRVGIPFEDLKDVVYREALE